MQKALVLFNYELQENILSSLQTRNRIKESHKTLGTFDVIAEINPDTTMSLREPTTQNLQRLSLVRAALALLTINEQN